MNNFDSFVFTLKNVYNHLMSSQLNINQLNDLMKYVRPVDGLKIKELTGYKFLGGRDYEQRIMNECCEDGDYDTCSLIFEKHPNVINPVRHIKWIDHLCEKGDYDTFSLIFEKHQFFIDQNRHIKWIDHVFEQNTDDYIMDLLNLHPYFVPKPRDINVRPNHDDSKMLACLKSWLKTSI